MNNNPLNRLGYGILGILLIVGAYAIITDVIQAASPLHSVFSSTLIGTAGITNRQSAMPRIGRAGGVGGAANPRCRALVITGAG